MKTKDLDLKVLSALEQDPVLSGMWIRAPESEFIPSTPERINFFLLVNLCVSTFAKSEDIIYACLSSLKCVYNIDIVKTSAGIEIAIFTGTSEKVHRALRFSVEKSGFNTISELTSDFFTSNKPYAGVKFHWYKKM